MGGIEELIDRRQAREAAAAVDQNSSVAREGQGVAGYGDSRRACATWSATAPLWSGALSGDAVQNIPFGFAAGMFGAYQLAALAGVPTTCKTSQCSIAFPSASIL
jgi:hypothetical protein